MTLPDMRGLNLWRTQNYEIMSLRNVMDDKNKNNEAAVPKPFLKYPIDRPFGNAPKEAVHNPDLAHDMALAEDPYIELQKHAEQLGLDDEVRRYNFKRKDAVAISEGQYYANLETTRAKVKKAVETNNFFEFDEYAQAAARRLMEAEAEEKRLATQLNAQEKQQARIEQEAKSREYVELLRATASINGSETPLILAEASPDGFDMKDIMPSDRGGYYQRFTDVLKKTTTLFGSYIPVEDLPVDKSQLPEQKSHQPMHGIHRNRILNTAAVLYETHNEYVANDKALQVPRATVLADIYETLLTDVQVTTNYIELMKAHGLGQKNALAIFMYGDLTLFNPDHIRRAVGDYETTLAEKDLSLFEQGYTDEESQEITNGLISALRGMQSESVDSEAVRQEREATIQQALERRTDTIRATQLKRIEAIKSNNAETRQVRLAKVNSILGSVYAENPELAKNLRSVSLGDSIELESLEDIPVALALLSGRLIFDEDTDRKTLGKVLEPVSGIDVRELWQDDFKKPPKVYGGRLGKPLLTIEEVSEAASKKLKLKDDHVALGISITVPLLKGTLERPLIDYVTTLHGVITTNTSDLTAADHLKFRAASSEFEADLKALERDRRYSQAAAHLLKSYNITRPFQGGGIETDSSRH